MRPGRILAAAGGAGRTGVTEVLMEGHADHQLPGADPRQFAAGGRQNIAAQVLEHFGAQHQIKGAIGEIELGDIARHRRDPGVFDLGPLKIESDDFVIAIDQAFGEIRVAGTGVERALATLDDDAHQIGYARLLRAGFATRYIHSLNLQQPCSNISKSIACAHIRAG